MNMKDKLQNSKPEETLEEAIPELAEIILRAYVADSDGMLFDPAMHQTLRSLFEAARANDFGDPLFWFIVAELTDLCEGEVGWALSRLDSAINELLRVRNAVAQRIGQPSGLYINQQMLTGFVGTTRQLTLKDLASPAPCETCVPDSLIDDLTVADDGAENGLADLD